MSLIQNYNVTYRQQVTKLRALNSRDVWSVVTPPDGQIQINTAMAGGDQYIRFIQAFSDPCGVANNRLHFRGLEACDMTGTGASTMANAVPQLTLTGCLISNVQLQQSIQDLIMACNVAVDFVSIVTNIPSGGGPGGGGP
jgi:hypothetical protein